MSDQSHDSRRGRSVSGVIDLKSLYVKLLRIRGFVDSKFISTSMTLCLLGNVASKLFDSSTALS